ncbi:MAG: hypothetical protein J0L67_02425 [Cytophagales bacterium]|nr:hypothetical protein [Cytophagales bacterium]
MKRVYSIGYEYVFYFFHKNWPDDIPQFNAAIFYSLILILWIAVLTVTLNIVLEVNSVYDFKLVLMGGYISLNLLNYFLFIRSKEYKNLARNFNALGANQRRLKRLKYRVGLLVVSLGFLTPFILLYLKLFFWN